MMEEENLSEEFSIMYEEPLRAKTFGSDTLRTPVRNIRQAVPVLMREEQSVLEAIDAMRGGSSYCAVVTRNAKVAGILTEHDIIARALPSRRDLADIRVG